MKLLTFLPYLTCLLVTMTSSYRTDGVRRKYDNKKQKNSTNIDDKYFHPYVCSLEECEYYLRLAVKKGEITEAEMTRELMAGRALTPRADIKTLLSDIKFILFSSKLEEGTYQYLTQRADHSREGWNKNRDVKIIVHGWSRGDDPSERKLRSQGIFNIAREYVPYDYNIICVDWTSLSSEGLLRYAVSASQVIPAAWEVATFVFELKEKGWIRSFRQVHLIGFSLGGQLVGRVGNNIRQWSSNDIIGRLTALDPAGPCFAYEFNGVDLTYAHLTKYDADFVDVVHCNQGSSVLRGCFGSERSSGTVDFKANGGVTQPGCGVYSDYQGCSHNKCPGYFRNSIRYDYQACKGLSSASKSSCPWYNPTCWFGRSIAAPRLRNFESLHDNFNPPNFPRERVRRIGKQASVNFNNERLLTKNQKKKPELYRHPYLQGRGASGTDCVLFGDRCPRWASGYYDVNI